MVLMKIEFLILMNFIIYIQHLILIIIKKIKALIKKQIK